MKPAKVHVKCAPGPLSERADVAISNIAGFSDKILYTCALHNNRLMAISRVQRGHGEAIWSMKTSLSNVCMARGPSRN